ncbi:MAG: hypothetical protein FJW39_27280 [Acidobacteria bacterium]|nr:hypothetical protein [Acidobacteriota bacterium]
MSFSRFICSALAFALIAPAQQPNKLVDTSKGTLKVSVIEGEGAKNNIRSRTATAPVVEVKDASDKPVNGAEVVFQLPMVGPSGSFNGWLKTQTVRTDQNGRATVTGYAPNDEAGRFNIKVTATSGSENGSVIVAQANIVGTGSSGTADAKKRGWWKPVAIIGGAAIAGGIIAASVGGDSPAAVAAASNPVTITPGAVTVGGPR